MKSSSYWAAARAGLHSRGAELPASQPGEQIIPPEAVPGGILSTPSGAGISVE